MTRPSEKEQQSLAERLFAILRSDRQAKWLRSDEYEAIQQAALTLKAVPSATAPHERGAMIERVAKALCRHAYPARTIDEYVAPARALWQRLIPEAEVAVAAMFPLSSGSKREGKDG